MTFGPQGSAILPLRLAGLSPLRSFSLPVREGRSAFSGIRFRIPNGLSPKWPTSSTFLMPPHSGRSGSPSLPGSSLWTWTRRGAASHGLQYIVFKRRPQGSGFEGSTLVKDRLRGADRLKFVVASGSGEQNQVVVTSIMEVVPG